MSHDRHDFSNPEKLRRSKAAAARREDQDLERVRDYLEALEAPQSSEDVRAALRASGHTFSSWRLRALLRYLVLRRVALEVRNAVPGRQTVLFKAAPKPPTHA